MTARVQSIAVAAALLVTACDRVPKNAVESCRADVQILPARTDLLFVIDDSGSMKEEQENLRKNLYGFVEALQASPVPLDFQIGVTTTDVRDYDGKRVTYASGPSAGVPYPRGRLVAVDPGARTDDAKKGLFLYSAAEGAFQGARLLPMSSPTLVDDFEANVLVGVSGTGKEQPLRALQLALGDPLLAAGAANAGFLRPGARLGVVILTDEDDCSELETGPYLATSNDLCHSDTSVSRKADLPAVSDLLAFLDQPIQGEDRDPVLAVIAGFDPGTLAATGCATSLDKPTRLAQALDQRGQGRSLRASICDASFGPTLEKLADLLVPQTVPLSGAPASGHMLLVSRQAPGAAPVSCAVAEAGEAAAQDADAVFTPPREGKPATLHLQRGCQLHAGDQLDVRLLCAQ